MERDSFNQDTHNSQIDKIKTVINVDYKQSDYVKNSLNYKDFNMLKENNKLDFNNFNYTNPIIPILLKDIYINAYIPFLKNLIDLDKIEPYISYNNILYYLKKYQNVFDFFSIYNNKKLLKEAIFKNNLSTIYHKFQSKIKQDYDKKLKNNPGIMRISNKFSNNLLDYVENLMIKEKYKLLKKKNKLLQEKNSNNKEKIENIEEHLNLFNNDFYLNKRVYSNYSNILYLTDKNINDILSIIYGKSTKDSIYWGNITQVNLSDISKFCAYYFSNLIDDKNNIISYEEYSKNVEDITNIFSDFIKKILTNHSESHSDFKTSYDDLDISGIGNYETKKESKFFSIFNDNEKKIILSNLEDILEINNKENLESKLYLLFELYRICYSGLDKQSKRKFDEILIKYINYLFSKYSLNCNNLGLIYFYDLKVSIKDENQITFTVSTDISDIENHIESIKEQLLKLFNNNSENLSDNMKLYNHLNVQEIIKSIKIKLPIMINIKNISQIINFKYDEKNNKLSIILDFNNKLIYSDYINSTINSFNNNINSEKIDFPFLKNYIQSNILPNIIKKINSTFEKIIFTLEQLHKNNKFLTPQKFEDEKTEKSKKPSLLSRIFSNKCCSSKKIIISENTITTFLSQDDRKYKINLFKEVIFSIQKYLNEIFNNNEYQTLFASIINDQYDEILSEIQGQLNQQQLNVAFVIKNIIDNLSEFHKSLTTLSYDIDNCKDNFIHIYKKFFKLFINIFDNNLTLKKEWKNFYNFIQSDYYIGLIDQLKNKKLSDKPLIDYVFSGKSSDNIFENNNFKLSTNQLRILKNIKMKQINLNKFYNLPYNVSYFENLLITIQIKTYEEIKNYINNTYLKDKKSKLKMPMIMKYQDAHIDSVLFSLLNAKVKDDKELIDLALLIFSDIYYESQDENQLNASFSTQIIESNKKITDKLKKENILRKYFENFSGFNTYCDYFVNDIQSNYLPKLLLKDNNVLSFSKNEYKIITKQNILNIYELSDLSSFFNIFLILISNHKLQKKLKEEINKLSKLNSDNLLILKNICKVYILSRNKSITEELNDDNKDIVFIDQLNENNIDKNIDQCENLIQTLITKNNDEYDCNLYHNDEEIYKKLSL